MDPKHHLNAWQYPNCMHVNHSKIENVTFAKYMKDAGYTVGLFGKYLNTIPPHTPEGFDAWMANGGGTYIAPSFSMSGMEWFIPKSSYNSRHWWWGSVDNYSTAVIGNATIGWIRKVRRELPQTPFFAYVAPKAAHAPYIPAPWHVDAWEPGWPDTEPRDNPPWNCSKLSRATKHGRIAENGWLTDEAAKVITGVFKNRWRTLMSVDDLIGAVIDECEDQGLLDNTYFFFTTVSPRLLARPPSRPTLSLSPRQRACPPPFHARPLHLLPPSRPGRTTASSLGSSTY